MSSERQWPYNIAQSTGTNSHTLLSSLLAAWAFDEISHGEDLDNVEQHIKNGGKADASGKTTVGLAFWVYPTGLYGPFRDTEDGSGQFEKHGTLITIEPGAVVSEAAQRARAAFRTSEIGHEHIAAAL